MLSEKLIIEAYKNACESYSLYGVDVEQAVHKADSIPVSMHCWQGDDVIGFDNADSLSGGIQVIGNYMGRARSAEELRSDMETAKALIPGTIKVNLHASYAELSDNKRDRDAYTFEDFRGWAEWAKSLKIGLDFNPTFFSHPNMDGNFSLSSFDDKKRRFWIEHGKRCREIALGLAETTGKPCAVNYWMPDGYKDICVDTLRHRQLMIDSLDEIFEADIDKEKVLCSVESKLFGLGVESYTVASHEFSLSYAISRGILYTLDAGHFHPTETISSKISALMPFMDKIMLHVSRGVRWDSDHVIVWDDELQNIMNEIVWNNFEKRVIIGLDYFDATFNRIEAWVLGMRNARKALLKACLAPVSEMRKAEYEGNLGKRLAIYEENKELPFSSIWNYYCLKREVPVGLGWLENILSYEKEILSKRD